MTLTDQPQLDPLANGLSLGYITLRTDRSEPFFQLWIDAAGETL